MVSIKYFSLNLSLFLISTAIASDLRRILPVSLKIREGEDLQLRLTRALPESYSCYVKTPLLTSYNLMSEEPDRDDRISYWTENGECGALVRNVTKQDTGNWRLTAKNSTNTLVDSSFVQVLDKIGTPERSFSIESGLPYTLTIEEQSRYCWVHQPHTQESIVVGGECKVELNRPTTAVEGSWSATTGIIGQLKEVLVEAKLHVFRDRLVTGYKRNVDTNTINAYCNLRDSEKELEFCRFSKPDGKQTGFQLSNGLRSGRYGYYGAGLENGECGITIEAPTAEDYGQWLCSIGVKDEKPFGSFVRINDDVTHAAVVRAQVLPTNAVTTALNDVLHLRCEVNVPISYCWFRAPNGEIFTPERSETEEDPSYEYIGNRLGKGHCSLELTTAEAKHEGQWSCHMGPEPFGFELSSAIDVRVAETPLAAKHQHLAVGNGETLALECRTVPRRTSIDYCRFFMPDGTGIHMSDKITENNPLILDGISYSFSGTNLQLGGCGLKIGTISSKHFGQWTCAARLELSENNAEVFDTIVVDQASSMDDLTAAATAGIVSGVIILVGILVAGSMYVVKKMKDRRLRDNNSGVERISVSGSTTSSESGVSGIRMQGISNIGVRR